MFSMKSFKSIFYLLLLSIGILAPWFFYPIFLMKILCFALFAAAFNLLLGYTGLLSFGHATFLAAVAMPWDFSCAMPDFRRSSELF